MGIRPGSGLIKTVMGNNCPKLAVCLLVTLGHVLLSSGKLRSLRLPLLWFILSWGCNSSLLESPQELVSRFLVVLWWCLVPMCHCTCCAGQCHCRGGSSCYWLWLQLCSARFGSGFTPGWERNSPSQALNRNLPLPGHAECFA